MRGVDAHPHAYCFVFTTPAPTEIYTLSLHDALPIWPLHVQPRNLHSIFEGEPDTGRQTHRRSSGPYDRRTARKDRKSTRLNSSHVSISYAVFCLKKKKHKTESNPQLSPPPLRLSLRP